MAGSARTSAVPQRCAITTSATQDSPATTMPLVRGMRASARAAPLRITAVSISHEIRRLFALGPRSRRAAEESYANRKGIPALKQYAVARLKGMSTPAGHLKSAVPRLVVLAKAPQPGPVSYTHLRAHETDSYLVCRLLL